MSVRGVAFTDVFNFRDLGGYPTGDGRALRWGRLYRSDDLSRLAEAECDRFSSLHIRTVVDLRRPAEVDQTGRIPTVNGVKYHHIHFPHPPWQQPEFVDTAHRARYLVARYRELTEQAGPEIAAVLSLIADESTAPLVFHCVAGKDRTGVLAALVLALLGVPEPEIAEDYHRSEQAEPASWAYYAREQPSPPPQRWTRFTVSPRDVIPGLFADLAEHYGSVAGYTASIGVSAEQVAAMRAHLLEPARPPHRPTA